MGRSPLLHDLLQHDARVGDVVQPLPPVPLQAAPQQAAQAARQPTAARSSQSGSLRSTIASVSLTVSPAKSRRPASSS